MCDKTPLVSIGIPTYNRVDLLDATIKCSVSQTYKNIEIIISDNDSPGDEVENLVKSYMKRDKRIVFKRQSKNIGPGENFKYLFNKAKGDYFLLAADDDIRSLNFIEKNLEFLEAHHDYIASTSPTRFKGKPFNDKKMGVNSLNGNLEERVLSFFDTWHANGRFSSLTRMNVVHDIYNVNYFLGNDWMIIVRLLLKGKFKMINEGWVILGIDGMSHNNVFSSFRNRSIELFLPFFTLTVSLFKLMSDASLKFKVKLFIRMIKLNFSACKLSIKAEIYKLYKRL
jgi:glycosyltransferase involved in cell wall biosynthesis